MKLTGVPSSLSYNLSLISISRCGLIHSGGQGGRSTMQYIQLTFVSRSFPNLDRFGNMQWLTVRESGADEQVFD